MIRIVTRPLVAPKNRVVPAGGAASHAVAARLQTATEVAPAESQDSAVRLESVLPTPGGR
jgi:hypothetical protein